MCERVVEDNSYMLDSVLDQYKTQKMCERVAPEEPEALEFVPNCYTKLQKIWHEDFDNDDNNRTATGLKPTTT